MSGYTPVNSNNVKDIEMTAEIFIPILSSVQERKVGSATPTPIPIPIPIPIIDWKQNASLLHIVVYRNSLEDHAPPW